MHFKKIDLNLLIVLDLLLQGKSVSDTARHLSLTQPAVSNSLSRLRFHFKDELLVPVGRRLTPTPFGLSLTGAIRQILEGVESVIVAKPTFDPETVERQFTLVCSDYVYSVFVAEVVKRLATVAPGIRVKALLNSDMSFPLLREGKSDFLIAPLFEDVFRCIVSPSNPLVADELSLETYLALGHVGVNLGFYTQPHLEYESLELTGVKPHVMVYAPTFNAVGLTVAGTNYISTVHARLARQLAEVMPLKVFDAPFETSTFRECLQWHKSKDSDTGIIWMRDFMMACAADMGPP